MYIVQYLTVTCVDTINEPCYHNKILLVCITIPMLHSCPAPVLICFRAVHRIVTVYHQLYLILYCQAQFGNIYSVRTYIRTKFGSASILQAFLQQLSENTKTAITFCKKKKINSLFFCNYFFFYSGRARVNRAGRKPLRAGRSALRNRPSWNTDL